MVNSVGVASALVVVLVLGCWMLSGVFEVLMVIGVGSVVLPLCGHIQ